MCLIVKIRLLLQRHSSKSLFLGGGVRFYFIFAIFIALHSLNWPSLLLLMSKDIFAWRSFVINANSALSHSAAACDCCDAQMYNSALACLACGAIYSNKTLLYSVASDRQQLGNNSFFHHRLSPVAKLCAYCLLKQGSVTTNVLQVILITDCALQKGYLKCKLNPKN